MYSIGLHFYLNIRASSIQLCAIRSCTISCEWRKGMNLIATPVARFTALNPQHNLALRSGGPISRQIAHHPTLTRNARSSPRILNYEYYTSLTCFCVCSWQQILGNGRMESRCHRIRFRPTPVTLGFGIATV
jgi:hypothetical protein